MLQEGTGTGEGREAVSQITSRCEHTVNTNIKRLAPPCFADSPVQRDLLHSDKCSCQGRKDPAAPVHGTPHPSHVEALCGRGSAWGCTEGSPPAHSQITLLVWELKASSSADNRRKHLAGVWHEDVMRKSRFYSREQKKTQRKSWDKSQARFNRSNSHLKSEPPWLVLGGSCSGSESLAESVSKLGNAQGTLSQRIKIEGKQHGDLQ